MVNLWHVEKLRDTSVLDRVLGALRRRGMPPSRAAHLRVAVACTRAKIWHTAMDMFDRAVSVLLVCVFRSCRFLPRFVACCRFLSHFFLFYLLSFVASIFFFFF